MLLWKTCNHCSWRINVRGFFSQLYPKINIPINVLHEIVFPWTSKILCIQKRWTANPPSPTIHPPPLKRFHSSFRYRGMTGLLTSKNLSGMAVSWLSFRESFSTEVKNLGWSPLVAERGVRLFRLLDERSRETSRSVSCASLSLLESSANHSHAVAKHVIVMLTAYQKWIHSNSY